MGTFSVLSAIPSSLQPSEYYMWRENKKKLLFTPAPSHSTCIVMEVRNFHLSASNQPLVWRSIDYYCVIVIERQMPLMLLVFFLLVLFLVHVSLAIHIALQFKSTLACVRVCRLFPANVAQCNGVLFLSPFYIAVFARQCALYRLSPSFALLSSSHPHFIIKNTKRLLVFLWWFSLCLCLWAKWNMIGISISAHS